MPPDDRELVRWCGDLLLRERVTAVEVGADIGDRVLSGRAGEGANDGSTDAGGALFDLASLSKPFSATLALALDRAGELALATSVGEIWPGAGRLATVRIEDLLRHTAGLRRWMPLYATCADAGELGERLLDGGWLREDREPTYSDLDYMLWCLSTEEATGGRYLDLLETYVLAPLGIGSVASSPTVGERALRCELPTGVEVELARAEGLEIEELPPPERGIAQDGNCRFLGRPMGHAGLFGDADALLRLGREWRDPGRVLSRERVEGILASPGRYLPGWYRSAETAAGRALGGEAFGHDGFTGGTLWVDRSRGLVLAALCHRSGLDVDLSQDRADLVERIIGATGAGRRP